jgi:hypothetical protein
MAASNMLWQAPIFQCKFVSFGTDTSFPSIDLVTQTSGSFLRLSKDKPTMCICLPCWPKPLVKTKQGRTNYVHLPPMLAQAPSPVHTCPMGPRSSACVGVGFISLGIAIGGLRVFMSSRAITTALLHLFWGACFANSGLAFVLMPPPSSEGTVCISELHLMEVAQCSFHFWPLYYSILCPCASRDRGHCTIYISLWLQPSCSPDLDLHVSQGCT